MKKIAALLIIGILVLSMTACNGSENETVKIKPLVVMVTNTAGLGDQGLNDVIWSGCEQARQEEDIDIRCLESASPEDYIRNMETAVQDGAVVIICAGEDMTDATKAAAEKYPDSNLVLVDGQLEMENVTCINFSEEEASFLAGIAAARSSETGVIGYIAGIQSPAKEKYQYGFTAGAHAVNPQIQVTVGYTGNFNSEEAGAALAREQREAGADVIFQSGGRGGLGVIDMAGKNDFKVIGSEKDQSGLDSKHVLCSVVKRADTAVYEEIEKALKNRLKGGTVTYNLKDDGVSLSDHAGNLPPEVKGEIQKWEDAIKKGTFVVPYDEKTGNDFVPPEI